MIMIMLGWQEKEPMVSTAKKPGFIPKPEQDQPIASHIHVHRASDIAIEELTWLWYPYVPMGKLTMLEGDPGVGKSWITCKIASDVSRGVLLPGQTVALPPQKVIMLSAEDGLGDTMRPRLTALGADLDKVLLSDSYFILDKQGLNEVKELIAESAAGIVFLDPVVAYMGGKMDMNKANEVRAMMGPLAAIARETGTPIITVRHLRKGSPGSEKGNAKYSGLGSIDFTAAVRSVLQVQESAGGTTYMAHVKHNLSPKGDSLAYQITDGRFQWNGVFQDAEKGAGKVSAKSKAVANAERFLIDKLKNGPLPASEVTGLAEASGISSITLQRAKAGLVDSVRGTSGWMWSLAGQGSAPLSIPTPLTASIDALARMGGKE
jgi:hypothetical protein